MDYFGRKIWINTNQRDNGLHAVSIVGHEAYHQFAVENPELNAEIINLIRAGVDEPAFLEWLRSMGYDEVTGITEEMASFLAGDFALEPEFWRSVVGDDRTLLQKILDAILRALDKVLAKIGLQRIKAAKNDVAPQALRFIKSDEDLATIRDSIISALRVLARGDQASQKTNAPSQEGSIPLNTNYTSIYETRFNPANIRGSEGNQGPGGAGAGDSSTAPAKQKGPGSKGGGNLGAGSSVPNKGSGAASVGITTSPINSLPTRIGGSHVSHESSLAASRELHKLTHRFLAALREEALRNPDPSIHVSLLQEVALHRILPPERQDLKLLQNYGLSVTCDQYSDASVSASVLPNAQTPGARLIGDGSEAAVFTIGNSGVAIKVFPHGNGVTEHGQPFPKCGMNLACASAAAYLPSGGNAIAIPQFKGGSVGDRIITAMLLSEIGGIPSEIVGLTRQPAVPWGQFSGLPMPVIAQPLATPISDLDVFLIGSARAKRLNLPYPDRITRPPHTPAPAPFRPGLLKSNFLVDRNASRK